MAKISIEPMRRATPMIYCYSTPEIRAHDGWVKIGYAEQQSVIARIRQQGHTVDVQTTLEWCGNALFEDGSGDHFIDKDFHAYLRRQKVENKTGTEWFRIGVKDAENKFYDFRKNRGVLKVGAAEPQPYILRKEQEEAVEKAKKYFSAPGAKKREFLWNAKPRFGKTLATYDLCRRLDAQNVLIVTNRPAIANSWYADYEKFLGTQSGYRFVSETQALTRQPLCLTRQQFVDTATRNSRCIEFISLQDLKGSLYFGGNFDKLKEISEIKWDLLVVDEAHEGIDTQKTDTAFDQIHRKYTLHLSGTPFKALANEKFPPEAIFNWAYADEQTAKKEWNSLDENPYATLPQLRLFTYKMSDIVRENVERGIEIDGNAEKYAFDLNEFFSTNNGGKFVYEDAVDKFLDALAQNEKFPFSTPELRDKLEHTFWLLERVDSAKALANKLREHPVFMHYEIVLAAGDGKLDAPNATEKSLEKAFNRVKSAIKGNAKTITISVGQLTTGVTVPEWTAILVLSNVKSPALYMQAAFRVQNPYLKQSGSAYSRKEAAYVFDFDPARTLAIYEKFANDLSEKTQRGGGTSEERKQNVRRLLNFFPVYGEDENGEMVELDAERVLSIPRDIHAREVVRNGFMSDFLFQNISNVFRSPDACEIIQKFTRVEKPKDPLAPVDPEIGEHLDENGNVALPEKFIIGQTQELFGKKIYGLIKEAQESAVNAVRKDPAETAKTENGSCEDMRSFLRETFAQKVSEPAIGFAIAESGKTLRKSDQERLRRHLKINGEKTINGLVAPYEIEKKKLHAERKKALENCQTKKESASIEARFKEELAQAADALKEKIATAVEQFAKDSAKEITATIETSKEEQEKNDVETGIRDHLRGFARTIPSFLMAYGNAGNTTLENFDKIVPAHVFKEVTSISLEEFRLLRDRYDLFDGVVFNDSVALFFKKKEQLKDYFAEGSDEDIFDYIPPQKTNQIFTPKKTVREMVDMLEQENPGCFDDPSATFADLYMKSGLFIAEIAKRLFQSKKMKRRFPNETARLKHIFENQLFGLAPTEIIYKIATNFLLGFDTKKNLRKNNFKLADAMSLAKTPERFEEEISKIFEK